MLNKFRKKLTQIILILFFIYFSILVFLYFNQRNLLYHPNENNYSGDKISVEIKKVKILTSDNIELLGWYHEKNLKDYKTLVFFHGNAGSLENRIHKLNHFKNMDLNFLIIAWRGFSGNKGNPSELGLYEDGQSAVDWLIEKGVRKKKYYPLWGVFRHWGSYTSCTKQRFCRNNFGNTIYFHDRCCQNFLSLYSSQVTT